MSRCDWEGCSEKNPFICAELKTYRDNGDPHRDTKFCSLEHLACWAINQGRREDLSHRTGRAKTEYLELLEEKVLGVMEDKALDHVKEKKQ